MRVRCRRNNKLYVGGVFRIGDSDIGRVLKNLDNYKNNLKAFHFMKTAEVGHMDEYELWGEVLEPELMPIIKPAGEETGFLFAKFFHTSQATEYLIALGTDFAN